MKPIPFCGRAYFSGADSSFINHDYAIAIHVFFSDLHILRFAEVSRDNGNIQPPCEHPDQNLC